MGLLGGISMLAIHITNDARRNGLNFFVQITLIAFFITSIEFLTGEIVNVRLGMNIWDYSDIPMNFDGQICLPFVGIWFVLSALGVFLDDFLRWKMFREDRNFSYLKHVDNMQQI
ncbi:MAG: putative ABC transporter permease [Ruminococcus sp.]|nr:putative ABC transporter permease [Ruminococcus sp.]